MKLKFENVRTLSDQKLIEGIRHCFANSDNLYKAAIALKGNKIFNVATSMLTLSIEEEVKAISLFMLLVFREPASESLALKEMFDSRDLHSSRLDFALFMTHFITKVDYKNLLQKDLASPENLVLAIQKKVDFYKIHHEVEREKKLLNNWFSHANDRKNTGLYVSFNNKWHTPDKIGKEEFEKAVKETKPLRTLAGLLSAGFFDSDEQTLHALISLWREMGLLTLANLENE